MNSPLFKVCLTAASFLLAVPAYAQVVIPRGKNQTGGQYTSANTGSLYVQLAQKKTAQKATTGNAARLAGLAYRTYDGTGYVIRDSTAFAYSGGRGSGPFELSNYNMSGSFTHMNCDSSHRFQYDPMAGSFTDIEKLTQTFDAGNNPLTKINAGRSVTNSWQNNTQELCSYDGANNLTGILGQIWDTASSAWQNSSKYTLTYTSGGKMQSALYESWDITAGSWINNRKVQYTYDGAGNMLSELTEGWNTSSSVWQNYSEEVNIYDAASHRATRLVRNWNTTTAAWENNSHEDYTYDFAGNLIGDLYKAWDALSGSWGNAANFQYSTFSGALPGTKIVQHWDGVNNVFFNSYRSETEYNSFGLPVFWSEQVWNATSRLWEPSLYNATIRYYYEPYVNEVKDIATMQGSAVLYPSPCKNVLNIAVEWNKEQDFTIVIRDINGRECYSKKVSRCKKYTEIVSTDDLTTGVYSVTMESAEGRIVKQIVVNR